MKRTGAVVRLATDSEGTAAQGRLLTLKQASDYLGALSVWALRERIWNGDIPVVRFPGGRKMFIDRDDLDALIDRNKARIGA